MTDDQAESRDQLLGLNDGTRLFFSSSIDYSEIDAFLKDSDRFKHEVEIEVLEFTGGSIKIRVDTPESGNLSYIDNWDPDWHGYIDSKETPLQLLFGTFKSLPLPQGEHIVEFMYQP